MSNIQYRACAIDDIDTVLKFWDSATHGGSINTREAILTFLDLHPDLLLLAWDGDRLVGSVVGA